MILMLGERETETLVRESQGSLSDLCAYRSVLCLVHSVNHN